MERLPHSAVKLATKARCALDVFRMLAFIKKKSAFGKVIAGMCMGKQGEITRILAPVVGSRFLYSSAKSGEETACGQLSIDELIGTYRIRSLSPSTSIYSLIGSPIEHSPGCFYHNAWFQESGRDSVYVKIEVKVNEVACALKAMHCPFLSGRQRDDALEKSHSYASCNNRSKSSENGGSQHPPSQKRRVAREKHRCARSARCN